MTIPPVGALLAAVLADRGWTQTVFAEILDRPLQFVNEVIGGKKELTRESASQVAAATGVPVMYWLEAQDEYHLDRLRNDVEFQAKLTAIKKRRHAKVMQMRRTE